MSDASFRAPAEGLGKSPQHKREEGRHRGNFEPEVNQPMQAAHGGDAHSASRPGASRGAVRQDTAGAPEQGREDQGHERAADQARLFQPLNIDVVSGPDRTGREPAHGRGIVGVDFMETVQPVAEKRLVEEGVSMHLHQLQARGEVLTEGPADPADRDLGGSKDQEPGEGQSSCNRRQSVASALLAGLGVEHEGHDKAYAGRGEAAARLGQQRSRKAENEDGDAQGGAEDEVGSGQRDSGAGDGGVARAAVALAQDVGQGQHGEGSGSGAGAIGADAGRQAGPRLGEGAKKQREGDQAPDQAADKQDPADKITILARFSDQGANSVGGDRPAQGGQSLDGAIGRDGAGAPSQAKLPVNGMSQRGGQGNKRQAHEHQQAPKGGQRKTLALKLPAEPFWSDGGEDAQDQEHEASAEVTGGAGGIRAVDTQRADDQGDRGPNQAEPDPIANFSRHEPIPKARRSLGKSGVELLRRIQGRGPNAGKLLMGAMFRSRSPKPDARSTPRPLKVGAFPPGRLGYAIGDIHGRLDLLDGLLEVIRADIGSRPHPIFGRPLLIGLGDYVDRGLESRGVLERLSTLPANEFQTCFLMGNHEQAMLAFLADGPANRNWLLYGGAETLVSYGVPAPSAKFASDADLSVTSQALAEALPPSHLSFLYNLEIALDYGDFYFVHAGVDPERELDDQTDADRLWIRERFLDSDVNLERIIVHGHTPVEKAERIGGRIALDTGAFVTGRLTAARFWDKTVEFLTTP